MEEVTLSEVKPWLQKSKLYKQFISEEENDEEEEKIVFIPREYYCELPLHDTWQETSKTLQVCNYWDVDHIPIEVIKFIFECEDSEEIRKIINNNEYYTDLISNIIKLKDISNHDEEYRHDEDFAKEILRLIESLNCSKKIYTALANAFSDSICNIVTLIGDVKLLKKIHEKGYSFEDATAEIAAEKGYLDCLKYLKKNNCVFHDNICNVAALNGRLNCLKYLHDEGYPWNEYTCASAAEGGYLECLKYLHKQK